MTLFRRVKCPGCEWGQFQDEAVGMVLCFRCNSTGYLYELVEPEPDEEAKKILTYTEEWLCRCQDILQDNNSSRALAIAGIDNLRKYLREQICQLFEPKPDEDVKKILERIKSALEDRRGSEIVITDRHWWREFWEKEGVK